MDKAEIRSLPDDELDALGELVEGEFRRREGRRKRSAIKQAKALLAAAGFDVQLIPLEEAAAKEPKAAKAKAPVVPAGVYRDPETGTEWQPGGRGRAPRWVREAQEAGLLDTCRVKEDEELDEEEA